MTLPAEILTEPAEYLAFWATAIRQLLGVGGALVILLIAILFVLIRILEVLRRLA